MPLHKKYPKPPSDEESGCVFIVGVAVMLVVVAAVLVAVIAFHAGVQVVAEDLATAIEDVLGGRAIIGLAGSAMLGFATWGLWRAATGKSTSGTSDRTIIMGMVIVVAIGVLGIAAIVVALFVYQPSSPF